MKDKQIKEGNYVIITKIFYPFIKDYLIGKIFKVSKLVDTNYIQVYTKNGFFNIPNFCIEKISIRNIIKLLYIKYNFNLLYKYFSNKKLNKSIYDYEREMEVYIKNILTKLNISCSTKTNPYSLPYNNELVINTINYSEYNIQLLSNKIFKELKDKGINKVRFYLHIEICKYTFYDKIIYHFRYYQN